MSDDIFAVLDEDRESELKGEKVSKEQAPFSPALLVDVSLSKNFFNSNCISVILVKPSELGKYYQYDIEITDKKIMEDLRKSTDDKAKKRLIGLNISIMNINKHLYELPSTARTETASSALNTLKSVLKERSIEVEIDFTPKQIGSYTNYYFKDIKGLGFKDPLDHKILSLVKEDLEQRKAAAAKKKAVEKPNQFYEEVIEKKITQEDDIPF